MAGAKLHDLSQGQAIPPGLLLRTEADLSAYTDKVRPIIEAVRTDGDRALQRFAREFDHVAVDRLPIRVASAEFDAAFAAVPADVVRAIEHAIDNIRRFHEAQKPDTAMAPGNRAGDLDRRAVHADRFGCLLRAARQGLVPERRQHDAASRASLQAYRA